MNTLEWRGLDTINASLWLQWGETIGFLVFIEELIPEKLEENCPVVYILIE